MTTPLAQVALRHDQDVVLARQRAKHVARALGFDAQTQTRIATAVTEIAGNVFQYASGGVVEVGFEVAPPALVVEVRDSGLAVAAGRSVEGSRRLMDRFDIATSPQGTRVRMAKLLPASVPPPTGPELQALAEELARLALADPVVLVHEQHRELFGALAALEAREAELAQLDRELEETNRGVIALFNELDDKAEALRQASELKSRFLNHVTHEFRTPLSSIVSLSRMLLERADGPLTPEQERQVRYVIQSAEALSELIDDVLDLAKIEAGKTDLRLRRFALDEVFAALRGMMRPLLTHDAVTLTFEDVSALPPLFSDEGKLSQILRNLVSNALKFTERGQVRIWAERGPEAAVRISVSDTGIGIAPADQQRIFTEFNQVDGPLQRKHRGTGLGLPLSRRLAELLGGTLAVQSAPGAGSTFSVTVPALHPLAAVPDELASQWRRR